jgi:hypothetical protein
MTREKKILIISYYWPPCGGIGVLRCLKFAKYLTRLGWDVTVFTAEDAHYPAIDHTNDNDIPENLKVIKQKIWEPYSVYKLITGQKKDANVNNVFYARDKKTGLLHKFSVWVRSNFFIPDARCFWVQPSVKKLQSYLKENPVDVILSNGPPHSNTRIATLIKKKTGIPWLADFQDPWSQVDYFRMLRLTKWGLRKHLRLEQEAFQAADKITIVSPTWKRDLEKIGAQNVSVLEWGYDPDDYKDLKRKPHKKFNIAHIGILGHDRNPIVLFKVLSELISENQNFREDFELSLVGQVDNSVRDTIAAFGLSKYTHDHGYVSRHDALQLTINSHILLLPLNQQDNVMGRIPGKLFEYLAVQRPIIVLGPKGSDSAKITESTNSGKSFSYKDASIKAHILKLYEQYKSGVLEVQQNNIERYSHENLIASISKELEELIKISKSKFNSKS